jgi:hypothetical protein
MEEWGAILCDTQHSAGEMRETTRVRLRQVLAINRTCRIRPGVSRPPRARLGVRRAYEGEDRHVVATLMARGPRPRDSTWYLLVCPSTGLAKRRSCWG